MPKDPKQTSKPGYITDPNNIEYEEQVYISRGLRDKDLQNQVVLNLTEEKIVKNGWRSGSNFTELFTHYYDGYAEYIDDCVNQINNS